MIPDILVFSCNLMRMLVCTSVLSYSLVLCFSHFCHVRLQNQEDLDFH